jgi:hypothetical protein
MRYHNTTGISATNYSRSRAKAGWKSSLDGIQIESGGQRLTRESLLRRTAAAPANASNRVKADQKALNLGSGIEASASLPQVNWGRGKDTPSEMTAHDGLGSAQ